MPSARVEQEGIKERLSRFKLGFSLSEVPPTQSLMSITDLCQHRRRGQHLRDGDIEGHRIYLEDGFPLEVVYDPVRWRRGLEQMEIEQNVHLRKEKGVSHMSSVESELELTRL